MQRNTKIRANVEPHAEAQPQRGQNDHAQESTSPMSLEKEEHGKMGRVGVPASAGGHASLPAKSRDSNHTVSLGTCIRTGDKKEIHMAANRR
jgi:hypothetical protein